MGCGKSDSSSLEILQNDGTVTTFKEKWLILEYNATLMNSRQSEETRRPTTSYTTHLTDGFQNWTNLFGVVVSHPPGNVFRVVPSFQNSSPNVRQAWITFGFDEIVKARKLRILKSF